MKTLKCMMKTECAAPVARIDEKGFLYCDECGQRRKLYMRCRKLKPIEIKQLESGKPLERY
jgi:hypothetical protein